MTCTGTFRATSACSTSKSSPPRRRSPSACAPSPPTRTSTEESPRGAAPIRGRGRRRSAAASPSPPRTSLASRAACSETARGNRPRSTVQIAKTGGCIERVADSNSGWSLSSGPEEPGPEEPSTFDPYAVDGRSHATIRDADAAYREEKSPDSGLVRRLQALACERRAGTDQDADGDSGRLGYATPRDEPNANARGGALVFGRSTRSYAECEETLTPPEVHLDVSCDDARRIVSRSRRRERARGRRRGGGERADDSYARAREGDQRVGSRA